MESAATSFTAAEIHETGDLRAEVTRILTFLQARYGFNLWMLTRTEGADWIVVNAADSGYNVKDGDVFQWADSFCSLMVLGQGPQIAPDSDLVPCYLSAEIGKQVPIRAYVGVPVKNSDGSLFGTLCAIDPEPKAVSIMEDLPLFNMFGQIIEKLIEFEKKAQIAGKEALASRLTELQDPMTGFPDRLAWEEALEKEELRAARLQEPAAILILDLDDLTETNKTTGRASGDHLLRRFAAALSDCLPSWALPFRLGGEEFAVLLQNCDPTTAREFISLIRTKMAKEGFAISSGIAMRRPDKGLNEAWELALLEMYTNKEYNLKAAA